MKSGKQKRLEIKAKRKKKALALEQSLKGKSYEEAKQMSPGIVKANHEELVHNNTYGTLPDYYADVVFQCRECGAESLWTAKAQKWWYEVAKGSIWSTASRCFSCRKARREAKAQQKGHMEAMAKKEPHPNEKFFRKR